MKIFFKKFYRKFFKEKNIFEIYFTSSRAAKKIYIIETKSLLKYNSLCFNYFKFKNFESLNLCV